MKRSSNSSRVQQAIGGALATQIRKQTVTRRDNRELMLSLSEHIQDSRFTVTH